MNRKNKDRSQISDSSFAQIKPHIFSIIKKKQKTPKDKKILSSDFKHNILILYPGHKNCPQSETVISSFTISSK